MKQEKWAERLEKHLKGYRKSPSRDLWEDIEASLDKQEKTRFVSFLPNIRSWLVAAALAGAVFTGTYLMWDQDPPVDDKVTASVVEKDSLEAEPEPSAQLSEDNTPLLSKTSDSPSAEESISKKEVTPEEHQTQSPAPNVQFPQHQSTVEPSTSILKKVVRQRRQIAVSLYASAGSGSWSGNNGVMMSPSLQQQFACTRGEQAYLVGYEERQSHDQPITFGLSLSYPLTNRLSVSTGVVYTKLNSDFLSLMPSHQIHRHQTLQYVGVPLSLHFRVWQWRGFSTYLTAGGQVEWNVKAEANTDGVDQELGKDRMQWSIGGSLGLQYNLLPQIGIYAEPGIRHYFNNGSNISNFYKDKPTNFNLQLGLRFNF